MKAVATQTARAWAFRATCTDEKGVQSKERRRDEEEDGMPEGGWGVSLRARPGVEQPRVLPELGSGGALFRIACEALCEKAVEQRRERGGQRRRAVLDDAVERRDGSQLEVGRLARQQLEHRAAERPDVRRRREA
eukprot:3446573-Pleurochrysis_carterae.AAC.3